jgi:hypothetical protein
VRRRTPLATGSCDRSSSALITARRPQRSKAPGPGYTAETVQGFQTRRPNIGDDADIGKGDPGTGDLPGAILISSTAQRCSGANREERQRQLTRLLKFPRS